MLTFAFKMLILLLGIVSIPAFFVTDYMYIFLLLVITATALCQYYQNKILSIVTTCCYVLIAFFQPLALVFLPVLFFDLAIFYPLSKTIFLLLINVLITGTENLAFQLLIGILALALAYLLQRLAELSTINREIQDLNAAQKSILLNKNQQLLEQNTDTARIAKLQERNRIARDIHDTIGHSLSRALLQTGALSAINQDGNLQPAIEELKTTLTNSMNSIRNSIHDLKDDAVDLQSALADLLDTSGFTTEFTYDIDTEVPNVVKNCFLIVLKESITNTRKHSDATKITVTTVEHPALYQFLVLDNGTKAPPMSSDGIGLQNIQERVAELGGYCRVNYQNGFRTFITIPKG